MVRTSGTGGKYPRKIAEREWRDGRDEVGIQSVHVALFSHVSRFTRHVLWGLADFFSILLECRT